MSFNHGIIKLDDSVETFGDGDPENTSGKQQHFYIISDVGVGRPYIVDNDNGNSQRTRPEGYDSLYVSKKALDGNKDGFISAEEYEAVTMQDENEKYEHEYVVTDPTQVLPRFVIR